MKLSSCYLEHSDSFGLRHAKRLKSWVGGYTVMTSTQYVQLSCVASTANSYFDLEGSDCKPGPKDLVWYTSLRRLNLCRPQFRYSSYVSTSRTVVTLQRMNHNRKQRTTGWPDRNLLVAAWSERLWTWCPIHTHKKEHVVATDTMLHIAHIRTSCHNEQLSSLACEVLD
jgi:hypothetical protein